MIAHTEQVTATELAKLGKCEAMVFPATRPTARPRLRRSHKGPSAKYDSAAIREGKAEHDRFEKDAARYMTETEGKSRAFVAYAFGTLVLVALGTVTTLL